MARKRREHHKVGDSWTATRKVGKKRKRVTIKKVGKSRYRIKVLSHKKKRR